MGTLLEGQEEDILVFFFGPFLEGYKRFLKEYFLKTIVNPASGLPPSLDEELDNWTTGNWTFGHLDGELDIWTGSLTLGRGIGHLDGELDTSTLGRGI